MDKPSERAREYLDHYRASVEPTAATVAAQRRRILERAARGDAPRVDEAAIADAAPPARPWGRIAAITLGVAAALALLLVGLRELVDHRIEHHLAGEAVMLGGGATTAEHSATPAEPGRPGAGAVDEGASEPAGAGEAAADEAAASEASPSEASPSEAATPASAAPDGATGSSAAGQGPARRPLRPRTTAAAVDEAPPADAAADLGDLRAESALLARARRALQEGDHAAALLDLDHHAERFPDGLLAEERLALAATARCRAGDLPAGRRLAAALAERFPGSLLAGRAQEACAGDGAP